MLADKVMKDILHQIDAKNRNRKNSASNGCRRYAKSRSTKGEIVEAAASFIGLNKESPLSFSIKNDGEEALW